MAAEKVEVIQATVSETERKASAPGEVAAVKDPSCLEVVKTALHLRVNHFSMPHVLVTFHCDHSLYKLQG
jgi:methionyl-tRNA formyltransferase